MWENRFKAERSAPLNIFAKALSSYSRCLITWLVLCGNIKFLLYQICVYKFDAFVLQPNIVKGRLASPVAASKNPQVLTRSAHRMHEWPIKPYRWTNSPSTKAPRVALPFASILRIVPSPCSKPWSFKSAWYDRCRCSVVWSCTMRESVSAFIPRVAPFPMVGLVIPASRTLYAGRLGQNLLAFFTVRAVQGTIALPGSGAVNPSR